MLISPAGLFSADQQGLFGTSPSGPSFHDYVYSSNQGFGVQSQYLTPNYTAAYRPAYGGPTGYPNPWQTGAGIGATAWYAASALPFPGAGMGANVPYYQSATGVNDYFSHNLVAIGPDAAANILQQYIAPIASVYAASKITNSAMFAARGAKLRAQISLGMGAGESLGYRFGTLAGRAMGGAAGGFLGGSTSALFGMGSVAGGASALSGIGGAVGGLVGSVAAPLAVGYGMYQGTNMMVFDPYVQTRRGAESLKSNMYNRALGGPAQSMGGGLGISSTSAYDISSSVNRTSYYDYAFKDSDYTAMMDYSMQAGLFDTFSHTDFNSQNVVKKVKEIAGSVKQIMAVFGEKSTQEAIAILSRFSKMGFGPGTPELSAGLSTLRATSAYSGRSANELMDSVFMPAAYSYQSQGLNAVMGGRAATDAYRGYESALRNGFVSKAVLASLGGAEGAAQLQTSGVLGLAGTQYNMMSAYSQQFFGANRFGGIGNTVTAFANGIGGDPLRAMGNMALYGNQMLNNQLSQNRLAPLTQAADLLRMVKPGQRNAADLAAVLTGTFGMSNEQAQAMVLDAQSALRSDTFSTYNNMVTEDVKQRLDAQSLTWTHVPAVQMLKQGYARSKEVTSTPGNMLASGMAYASDKISQGLNWAQYGLTNPNASGSQIGQALAAQGAGNITRYSSTGKVAGADKVSSYVNKYATSLDPRIRSLAANVIKDGSVNTDAFIALKKATGDGSVNVQDVIALAGTSGAFSSTTDNFSYSNLQGTIEKMAAREGLSDVDLLIEYQKLTSEDEKRAFHARYSDRISAYARDHLDKNEIKYSGAFSNPLWADNGIPNLSMIPANSRYGKVLGTLTGIPTEDRLRSTLGGITPGSDKGLALTQGMMDRLTRRSARSWEGQIAYLYKSKGLAAAQAAMQAGPGIVSDIADYESGTQFLEALGNQAGAAASNIDLNQSLKGIDFSTGLNLDAAIKGSNNTIEKGGAMILKAANIMAAVAEQEAQAKKVGAQPDAPSPLTSWTNRARGYLEEQAASLSPASRFRG